MASGVDEWRRHLKGCAAHLQAQKWNGSSKGIVKSCFWAFARIDVWAAFISRKTTLIPTNFWLDDMSIPSVATRGDIDDYCNLANLIFAEIVNFLATHGQDKGGHDSAYAASVSLLWQKLQDWRGYRPQEVKPLLRNPAASSKVFPVVLYSRSSSICGNTFYHSGSILLLQTGEVPLQAHNISSEPNSPVWHARELGGISISNPSHANWVNQAQPLYIAGTVFTPSGGALTLWTHDSINRQDVQSQVDLSVQRGSTINSLAGDDASLETWEGEERYAAEKVLLLKQLVRIERETGWKTSDRAVDLRLLWGMG
ncbi:hypothetical protein ASPVEDRAFT_45847 [Aspergillus versicolor CBS 583.65]|uniref:Uncharacterized protein n=1 Tax=Aspergillus versicolor CBS 583.65 TaxID=1036611 RepID=A0A1L9PY25_ASPVE|nr:uncharacterized protein ASPVEDRAFT_45847 [Aspergillus versicolor CBS 583.65]OJJ06449.1 hypothetical protein ASPVEDRAFT_45847 [Aspergillus versicolor CBS 583.65]